MKNRKTKTHGCRLNEDETRQAEFIAAREGDESVGALMKRLLTERMKNCDDSGREKSGKVSPENQMCSAAQLGAIANVRELITTSFGLLFEATGTSEVFQSKKHLIDEKWNEILTLILAPPHDSSLRSNEVTFEDIRDDEIQFKDLFGGEFFSQVPENYPPEKLSLENSSIALENNN